MDLLHLDHPLPEPSGDPVLVVALDGWTDAGAGGSIAAHVLRDTFEGTRLGSFDPDLLYDYRDRRPELAIDRGLLGEIRWPSLTLDEIRPTAGPTILLAMGAEPDFAWRRLARELLAVAHTVGAKRYVGLGSVPGPIPHTRPAQVISTGTDPALLDRFGRPHEEVVVPASCQVVLEKAFADAGMITLGMWARIPHYVAGEYPQAARILLERFSAYLGTPVEVEGLEEQAAEQQARLDLATAQSDEIRDHVRQLESLYDAEMAAERAADNRADPTLSEADVPSADELAAEIERFLRGGQA